MAFQNPMLRCPGARVAYRNHYLSLHVPHVHIRTWNRWRQYSRRSFLKFKDPWVELVQWRAFPRNNVIIKLFSTFMSSVNGMRSFQTRTCKNKNEISISLKSVWRISLRYLTTTITGHQLSASYTLNAENLEVQHRFRYCIRCPLNVAPTRILNLRKFWCYQLTLFDNELNCVSYLRAWKMPAGDWSMLLRPSWSPKTACGVKKD